MFPLRSLSHSPSEMLETSTPIMCPRIRRARTHPAVMIIEDEMLRKAALPRVDDPCLLGTRRGTVPSGREKRYSVWNPSLPGRLSNAVSEE